MAGIMRICAGLVGPKSENVDFSLVFQAFLKGGQESHEDSKKANGSARGGVWEGVGGG